MILYRYHHTVTKWYVIPTLLHPAQGLSITSSLTFFGIIKPLESLWGIWEILALKNKLLCLRWWLSLLCYGCLTVLEILLNAEEDLSPSVHYPFLEEETGAGWGCSSSHSPGPPSSSCRELSGGSGCPTPGSERRSTGNTSKSLLFFTLMIDDWSSWLLLLVEGDKKIQPSRTQKQWALATPRWKGFLVRRENWWGIPLRKGCRILSLKKLVIRCN